MVEELEEIWTNYDRQTVFNYVETRLHHYLFTKIFKDEAEIMSKIIEINEPELLGFKYNHFLNIPETQELINNFDDLKSIDALIKIEAIRWRCRILNRYAHYCLHAHQVGIKRNLHLSSTIYFHRSLSFLLKCR